jgi:hypothetical protein
MNKNLKIIEVSDYILAVSDEKIKEENLCINLLYKKIVKPTDMMWANANKDNLKKIIAYQPKTDNTPELDLPLLLEIVVEDDIEKLAYEYYTSNKYYKTSDAFHWTNGYKEATKKYSEAIDAMQEFVDRVEKRDVKSKYTYTKFKNIIQSLKQPKTPTHFLAEIEDGFINELGDFSISMNNLQGEIKRIKRLKTEVVDGKTYLVGKYLYE